MKGDGREITRIIEIIHKNQSGVILVPPNPSVDTIASATALYLILNKMGKNISLASSQEINFDQLTAGEKFETDIKVKGDNLMISFPYTDGSIDKIDYNIQGNFFNLIISPRPGQKKLDPSQVKFSYSGGKIDFFIILDSPNLNYLGEIYLNNKDKFNGCEIINIDRHLTNMNFGTVNYINKTASCLSEVVFEIIERLNVEIDKDIATNLYVGLTTGTNNFTSYSVTANTLETGAKLLKLGAVKKIINKPKIGSPSSFNSPFFPTPQKFTPPSRVSPSFSESETPPIEIVEKEKEKENKTAPQDWLKPKIFRGNLI